MGNDFDFASFITDESLENNGTWFPAGGNSEFLVARTGNDAYSKKITAEFERNKMILDMGGPASEKVSEQIMLDTLASTVLLGWRTKQADGSYVPTISFKKKAVAYSVDAARDLLRVKDIRRMVNTMSTTVEAFKAKEEAEQGEA